MIAKQIIVNGNFEEQLQDDGSAPVGWVVDPVWPVVSSTYPVAYSGKWHGTFGSRSAATSDSLYQLVDIPDSLNVTLSFQLDIANTSSDTDYPYTTFSVKVRDKSGTVLDTLGTWSNQDDRVEIGYFRVALDMTAYSGQMVQVWFGSVSTDSAQNTLFVIDDVRLDAVLRLPDSTYPPLVSNLSTDSLGSVQQYGNHVYCSYLIRSTSDDPFFNPVTKGLTGYAADGFWYKNGVQNRFNRAPWWAEALGGGDQLTRGATQEFPTSAIVLVTDGGISILDLSDNLNMWMIFKKGSVNAYSDTFGLDEGAILLPKSVGYSGGTVSITFEPQPSSTVTSVVSLNIDFTQDTIMLDLAV